ncbi:MAG: class I SAM-dependent methyltransferase [Bacteroidia bacterium]
MQFKTGAKSFQIKRYPPTSQRSLQAWNAADEHILTYLEIAEVENPQIAICHDRFGFLACALHERSPLNVLTYSSQVKALHKNLTANKLELTEGRSVDPLNLPDTKVDLAIVKIPKSLDLFRFYLHQMFTLLADDGEIVCGFMTRHFTAQMLKIAETYFSDVRQSRAHKKSRLLHLTGKKTLPETTLLQTISFEGHDDLQTYPGVFAGKSVDIATRFLLDNLLLREEDKTILDLGAGYGVIGKAIHALDPSRELHLMDDNYLANASAKLNLKAGNVHFHYADSMADLGGQKFDFVVSNPPFHFEHENNIEIPLSLFAEVKHSLNSGGHFQLVANHHLNYKTHLGKMFRRVKTVAENPKFVVYDCS